MVQMYHALGPSRRTGAIHTESHFVAVCTGFRQRFALKRDPLRPRNCIHQGKTGRARGLLHEYHVPQTRRTHGLVSKQGRQDAVGDGHFGARILQVITHQFRRRQGIEQHRHVTRAHGTEDGGHVLRCVWHQHEHAAAARKPQRAQTIACARSQRAKLRVSQARFIADEGELLLASRAKVIEQYARAVVVLRQFEDDLPHAAAFPVEGIGHAPRIACIGHLPPALANVCHEPGRHAAQPLVTHAAAARHVIVGQLPWRVVHLVGHALVPKGAGIGRRQDFLHHGAAFALEHGQCGRRVLAGFSESAVQGDGILQRQPRARADGKMRGVQRVADQHRVAGGPVTIGEQRKVAPDGFVRHQGVAFEVRRENLLAVAARLLFGHATQARAVPGGRVALHQKSAHAGAVAVVVRYPSAMLVSATGEREAIECLARSIPCELVGEPLRARFESLRMRASHEGVQSIRAHDQMPRRSARQAIRCGARTRDSPLIRDTDLAVTCLTRGVRWRRSHCRLFPRVRHDARCAALARSPCAAGEVRKNRRHRVAEIPMRLARTRPRSRK